MRKAVGQTGISLAVASFFIASSLGAQSIDPRVLQQVQGQLGGGANAGDAVRGRSPVVMVTDLQQEPEMADVLVNLTDTVALGFERFVRVIEVVSTNAADRDLARQRWRQYTEQGYTIARHDLTLKRVD